ncbi:MAG: HAD family hydrolase [Bacillota bacterium]|nr:HAD family hydrolase [Bacillota bacterium]
MKMVLFDLDGTLLSMDQEYFTKRYFGLMTQKMAKYGYEPERLISMIWKGCEAMAENDGTCLNEECFWKVFDTVFPGRYDSDYPLFEEFYENEFQMAKDTCTIVQGAKEVIQLCKELGLRVSLATNPVFPATATKSRIHWAGFSEEDFELVTTYENSHSCKPNLNFYQEICEKLNVRPEECLMVGNDVDEDMIAKQLGMEVFLLTNDLINRHHKDIDVYPHGNMMDLKEFLINIQK